MDKLHKLLVVASKIVAAQQTVPAVAGCVLHARLLRLEKNACWWASQPLWTRLSAGLRPAALEVEDQKVGILTHGWQQATTEAVHSHLVETSIRPKLSATD